MGFDQFTEENKAIEWDLQEPSNQEINIEDFASLCITGLSVCEDNCLSRQLVGQHRCRCVRARFDCPAHYQLYKQGRQTALELIAAKGLGELTK